MVQQVCQRLAGHDHRQVGAVGEVRQAHVPGWMALSEYDLLFGAVHGTPAPHATFQRATHAAGQLRMATQELLEDRHRAQMGRVPQHRHDLFIEDASQSIGPSAHASGPFL